MNMYEKRNVIKNSEEADKSIHFADYLKLSQEEKKHVDGMIISTPPTLLNRENKYTKIKPNLSKIIMSEGFKNFLNSNFPILDEIFESKLKETISSSDLENENIDLRKGEKELKKGSVFNFVAEYLAATDNEVDLCQREENPYPSRGEETLVNLLSRKRKVGSESPNIQSVAIKEEHSDEILPSDNAGETQTSDMHVAKKIKTEIDLDNYESFVVKEEIKDEICEDEETPIIDIFNPEKREYLLLITVACLKYLLSEFEMETPYEKFLECCDLHFIKGIDYSQNPNNDIWETNLKLFAVNMIKKRSEMQTEKCDIGLNYPLVELVRILNEVPL